VQDRQRF